MVVNVCLTCMFTVEILMRHVAVAHGGVVVFVGVLGAEVLEAPVRTVVMGDMKVLVRVH